ncbi:MAG: hypothetical protein ACTHK3_05510 [Solirubrobacterales bacterium]
MTAKQGKKIVALMAAALVASALAPAAAAQADGVDGGVVHLKLTDGMSKRFAKEGVRLFGLKPAKASRAGLALPVSGGLLDSKGGSGYLFLEGGFKLVAGKRSVKVKRLVFNTAKRSLSGRVDGVKMQVARLSSLRATIDGFSLDLGLNWLKPTAKAAAVFNRRLGVDRTFAVGRSLGSADAVAEFEWLTIRSGEIAITIDPGFEDKLTSVEAAIWSSGSAKLLGTFPTKVSIPVEGGQIAPDASTGVLLTQGGLDITQHEEPFDNSIAFLDTNIALDSHLVSGDANYNPNPKQIPFSGPIATFPNAIAVQSDAESGAVSASSIPVALHPNFASVLNEALGAPKAKPDLFSTGEVLGTVSFQALTR